MKRLNPLTNQFFKFGDTRKDGRIFYAYTKRIKKDGYFVESWLNNDSFNNQKKLKKETYEENKQEVLNRNFNYYLANKNKILNHKKAYKTTNQHRYTALNRNRELLKRQRTPQWLNNDDKQNIIEIYKKANKLSKEKQCQFHVDHIVPLNGKNVSGLHVPWNLQIITASENLRKYNKFMETV